MLKMNVILAIAASVVQIADASPKAGEAKHPIRQEIVDEIKLKATSWKPQEVSENHLRHRSVESLKASMGYLGTSQASFGADVFKSVTKSAMDVFKQISSTVGLKESTHRVKQSSPTSDSQDDEDKYDLPVEFSWRSKFPECLG